MNKLTPDSNAQSRRLIMDRSVAGRVGTTLLPLDVPEHRAPPGELLRGELEMPELSEGEIVRYFSQLSQFNFSIDHNFYPLGSCTMKYNPKVNDEIAGLAGFSEIHPLQEESTVQGALKLMYLLQKDLAENSRPVGLAENPRTLVPRPGVKGEEGYEPTLSIK